MERTFAQFGADELSLRAGARDRLPRQATAAS